MVIIGAMLGPDNGGNIY